MKTVSQAVVDDNISFFERNGISMKGAFQNVPGDIVERVATGKVAKNNITNTDWTLSKDIWTDIHKTQKDTNMTFNDLKLHGFSDEIVAAIESITKIDGEEYETYLTRVKSNKIARDVKIADIQHNSDLSRLKEISQKDYDRLKKYKKALRYLTS